MFKHAMWPNISSTDPCFLLIGTSLTLRPPQVKKCKQSTEPKWSQRHLPISIQEGCCSRLSLDTAFSGHSLINKSQCRAWHCRSRCCCQVSSTLAHGINHVSCRWPLFPGAPHSFPVRNCWQAYWRSKKRFFLTTAILECFLRSMFSCLVLFFGHNSFVLLLNHLLSTRFEDKFFLKCKGFLLVSSLLLYSWHIWCEMSFY